MSGGADPQGSRSVMLELDYKTQQEIQQEIKEKDTHKGIQLKSSIQTEI